MWFRVKQSVFLIGLLLGCVYSSNATVAVGQDFPDFTLASAHSALGQRLYEQRGNPVMLLVLNRCNQCQDKLLDFQLLATSFVVDDLTTWVVWQPYKKHLPPQLHIPVLNAQSSAQSGWDYSFKKPTLLLIDREGVLVHQESGSIKKITANAQKFLPQWMLKSQARPEGR